MQEKVILFSPETFNLAETTRCIEIAKKMPASFKCIFSGYSDKFSYLIEEEGFAFYHLAPKMAASDVEAMMNFDQGKTLKNPLNYPVLQQRVAEEMQLIKEMKVVSVVIGSTLSMMISARACQVTVVYVKPYAYSKAHLLNLNEQSTGIESLFSKLLLSISYIPSSFRRLSKELGVKPFTKTIDLVEADYNLITTLPELINYPILPKNYHIVGPVYANLKNNRKLGTAMQTIVNQAKKKNSPIIYFAMGSSSNKAIIMKSLIILKNLPVTVIAPVKLYLDPADIQQFEGSAIHIHDFLPAIEVSKMVDFSFIHGGEGTVQTACLSGKPFIGFGLQSEQKKNLEMCADFGNSLTLKKINEETVHFAIEELLNNPKFSKQALRMSELMKQSAGANEAADFLVTLLNK